MASSASALPPEVATADAKLRACERDTSACLSAVEALTQIRRGNPYFAWAVTQNARVLYKLQKWNEFFGMVWIAKGEFTGPRLAPLAILEALAFIRHCRFSDSAKDADFATTAAKQGWDRESAALRELLPMIASMPWEKLINATKSQPRGGDPRAWWKVSVESLRSLDPYRVHRRVTPMCGDGGAP